MALKEIPIFYRQIIKIIISKMIQSISDKILNPKNNFFEN